LFFLCFSTNSLRLQFVKAFKNADTSVNAIHRLINNIKDTPVMGTSEEDAAAKEAKKLGELLKLPPEERKEAAREEIGKIEERQDKGKARAQLPLRQPGGEIERVVGHQHAHRLESLLFSKLTGPPPKLLIS
jgi:hypothetical protein